MKMKILAMLLAVCVVASCFAAAIPATAEEHECVFTYLPCGFAQCWCGNFEYGWNHAWTWQIVNSQQHCKRCIYCNITGSYENHGWYTSGGSTYCGSCGYPKP